MSALKELLRYLKICLFPAIPLIAKNFSKNTGLVVSLTTTPDRLPKIRQTLLSLLDQSIQPNAIFLNLPEISLKGKTYDIPVDLMNFPLLTINRPKLDQGPATKSLPVLADPKVDEDTLIVVLDDDQVYPYTLLETYLRAGENAPDQALTICGWKVPSSLKHADKKILRGAGLKLTDPKPNVMQDEMVEIIQGASSYAVRKRFFTKEISDFSIAPPKAMFADDIWISGQLAKNNIPRKLIKAPFAYCRIMSLSHFKTEGLRDTANADNTNNDNLYHYFQPYWKLYS